MIIVRNLELAKIIKKIDADDVARSDKKRNSKALLKNSIKTLTDTVFFIIYNLFADVVELIDKLFFTFIFRWIVIILPL